MIRVSFEKELKRLTDEVILLGTMAKEAILESVQALKKRDMQKSKELIANDQQINKKRYAIEADTLVLIATQQPMASDLRTLAAILEISTELERIGDYAKGISKINLMIGDEPLIKPLIDIPRMADIALDMLDQSIKAFQNRDVELARAIPNRDDEVDALYDQVYRELLTIIMGDPKTIDQANYLLWAAHNLERTADRVSNICERVIFTVTGEVVEMDVEDSGLEGIG
jgi:phosphate transport system protein